MLKQFTIQHFYVGFVLCLMACQSSKPADIAEAQNLIPKKVDFNFHVRPILSDKCFACHGPDEKNREGELRLDIEAEAKAALGEEKDRFAIKSGNLAQSHVFHRIISTDPEEQMPPPESKLELSLEEKAMLTRWIEQGATYKPHWAFIPPKATKRIAGIDGFIKKELQKKGIKMSDQADKETLIRRASFDLRGLPPSLEEVNQFLANDSPNAYEELIDALLASSAYGERMAADWMDVARYADSDGYLDDKHREFWPWRDWVIKAFNDNMPYDQFASWQLAGDLVANASQESKLATAFNRLHKKNSEAGIVYEEYRVEYVADRTNTLGKAFLGLSLECARCHDHKFDPISQADYFKMFGFFNSTFEMGSAVYGPDQTPGPSLMLSTTEQQEQIDFLNKTIQTQTAQQQNYTVAEKELQNWLSSINYSPKKIQAETNKELIAYYPFDLIQQKANKQFTSSNPLKPKEVALLRDPTLKQGYKGKAFFVNDYNRIFLPDGIGEFERTDPFSIEIWVRPDTFYQEAGIYYHCEDRRLGYKGYALFLHENKPRFMMAHSWPQNALQLTAKSPLPAKTWSKISVTYDGSSQANGISMYINGEQVEADVDMDHLYKGLIYEYSIHTYGKPKFILGTRDKVDPFKGGGIDELKIYKKELSALEILTNYDSKALSNALNGSDRLVQDHFRKRIDPVYLQIQDSLRSIRIRQNNLVNKIPEIMAMGDLPEPRATFVLDRGMYDSPMQEVQPGTPDAILAFSPEYPKNRLGLTQWMFNKENPLTARVMVNRIWQMHFGRGLVKTAEDFGSQGSLPSHPELLDWLAIQFMESGWDIKAMHKLIMMSKTYRQSSKVRPELADIDPENILLARGPRFRLSAEMIRDNALAISGLLVDSIGGPSTYPYQPAGLWDEISNKSWRYPYLQKPGDGLYRRSLYTVWKRTAPPPSMLIFDLADRSTCQVRRTTTSTPLQALVLLNDPQYLEACRVLAEKLLAQAPNLESSLITAHRLINGRNPDEAELTILSTYFNQEKNHYDQNQEAMLAYLSNGEIAWDESIEPAALAAMSATISGMLNSYEASVKD